MKTRILIIAALLIQAAAFASPPEEGKVIFLSRCASCHNVNKQIIGPALAGVDQRRSIDWIIRFVNSSQSVIKSGDSTAVGLFQKFNKVPMPDHSDLTGDDIKKIVDYIKAEASAVPASTAPFAKPGRRIYNYTPLSLQQDHTIFIGFFVVLTLLIASMLIAVRSNEFKKELVEKNLS